MQRKGALPGRGLIHAEAARPEEEPQTGPKLFRNLYTIILFTVSMVSHTKLGEKKHREKKHLVFPVIF